MIFMEVGLLKKYEDWVSFSRMKFNAITWIIISIVISVVIGLGAFTFSLFLLQGVTLLPFAFTFASLVLFLGYPYLKTESIIDSIENNFSDALKQMADTLKAGDTYESALREVVNAEYGRLSEEMAIALRRLEEGENIDTALRGFSERINSRLIRRTIVIILDSIKTGSSLAEILDNISDDVRDIYKLKEERKSSTTMQFMFMVAAGGFIAPLIFGEVTAIMGLFSDITLSALTKGQIIASDELSNYIFILIQGYLIIEVIASGVMMGIIREGKINKSIIYIPALLLIAFIMYYAATIGIGMMLSGAF